MSSPTPSNAIENLRPDLQGLFEEFDLEMNLAKMIGLQLAPVIDVGLQAGPFGKITLESLMKQVDTARKTGAYNETDFEFTDDSYATKENGISVPVDKRNAKIYENYFSAEAIAARLARAKVMQNLEIRIATLLFGGTFNTVAAATAWDTVATAVPITDVESAVQRLYDKGIVANCLVVSWKRFRKLRQTVSILERIMSDGAGTPTKAEDVTVAMLKAVFDLPHILVGGSQKSTTKEGQTASLSSVWSDSFAAVTRIAMPGAPIIEPCWARTFHWGEDGSTIGGTMESWYDPNMRGDKVRCRMETHEKVMYTEAVELLTV